MAFTVLQIFFKIVPNFHLLNCQTQLSNFWCLDYWKMHYQSKNLESRQIFLRNCQRSYQHSSRQVAILTCQAAFFKNLSPMSHLVQAIHNISNKHILSRNTEHCYLADVIYQQSKHTFLRIFCINEPTYSPKFMFKWSFAFRFPWQLSCHISQDGHSNPIFLLHEI